MSDAAASSSSFDSRPVPDPTVLSTAQLDREIGHLKELLRSEQMGAQNARNERFAGIDSRLNEMEDRRKELKLDTENQVQSALNAAKSEIGLLRLTVEALATRVTAAEAQKVGGQSITSTALAVVGAFVAVGGLAVAIILAFN